MSQPPFVQGAVSGQPPAIVEPASAPLAPQRPAAPAQGTGSRLSDRTTIIVDINVAQIIRALLLGAAALAAAIATPSIVRAVASADIRITISSLGPPAVIGSSGKGVTVQGAASSRTVRSATAKAGPSPNSLRPS